MSSDHIEVVGRGRTERGRFGGEAADLMRTEEQTAPSSGGSRECRNDRPNGK